MNPKQQKIESRGVRYATILVNGILFLINFLLFFFVWTRLFPQVEGLWRLLPCWLLAYLVTWVLVYLTNGIARLYVTLAFLGLLTFVLLYR
jgi:hypothetical protein